MGKALKKSQIIKKLKKLKIEHDEKAHIATLLALLNKSTAIEPKLEPPKKIGKRNAQIEKARKVLLNDLEVMTEKVKAYNNLRRLNGIHRQLELINRRQLK